MKSYRMIVENGGDVAKRNIICATDGFSRQRRGLEITQKPFFSGRLFLLLVCCLTLIVPVFPQQKESFNSVWDMVEAMLDVNYDIVSIAASPKADDFIRRFGKEESSIIEDRVVHLGIVRSNSPITSAQYELGRARTTAGLGRDIRDITESTINDMFLSSGGVPGIDIQTIVSITVSQAVVSSQRVEEEIWVRAKHKENGQGYYMCISYVSAKVPSNETIAQMIKDVSANNGTPGRGGKTTSITPMQTAEEKLAFAEFVKKLLSENPDWRDMNERFGFYFGK